MSEMKKKMQPSLQIPMHKPLLLGIAVALALIIQACIGPPENNRAPSQSEAALMLNSYRLSTPPVHLEPQVSNASGLTFNTETGTLFLVLNGPTKILELTRGGEILRTVDLVGFEDTEGIAHLGADRFAVAEERRRTVALIDIPAGASSVDHAAAETVLIEPQETGNKGLEGLSYDPVRNQFVSVREKRPRTLYRFAIAGDGTIAEASVPWNVQRQANGLRDLSGIHIDAERNHILLLSDESKTLVEFDAEGWELSRMLLKKGSAGLSGDVPQAEGVTVDDQGTLYICSEPNLLYIFKNAAVKSETIAHKEEPGGR